MWNTSSVWISCVLIVHLHSTYSLLVLKVVDAKLIVMFEPLVTHLNSWQTTLSLDEVVAGVLRCEILNLYFFAPLCSISDVELSSFANLSFVRTGMKSQLSCFEVVRVESISCGVLCYSSDEWLWRILHSWVTWQLWLLAHYDCLLRICELGTGEAIDQFGI